MTKDELEKEAEEINITYENNVFHCTKNGTKWISIDGEKWYGEEKRIEELEKVNAELEQENTELKEELKNWKDEWQEQVQKAIDEGYARTQQTIQLTNAKELLKNIIRVTWGEGWNYSLDWKVKAEQFLKEIEK